MLLSGLDISSNPNIEEVRKTRCKTCFAEFCYLSSSYLTAWKFLFRKPIEYLEMTRGTSRKLCRPIYDEMHRRFRDSSVCWGDYTGVECKELTARW